MRFLWKWTFAPVTPKWPLTPLRSCVLVSPGGGVPVTKFGQNRSRHVGDISRWSVARRKKKETVEIQDPAACTGRVNNFSSMKIISNENMVNSSCVQTYWHISVHYVSVCLNTNNSFWAQHLGFIWHMISCDESILNFSEADVQTYRHITLTVN